MNVTFPEDYGNADVAGKDAVFSTTLNYISETVLPELTDEWVQANLTDAMGFADVSELNAFVSNQISLSNQSGDVYSALYAKAGFAGGTARVCGELLPRRAAVRRAQLCAELRHHHDQHRELRPARRRL